VVACDHRCLRNGNHGIGGECFFRLHRRSPAFGRLFHSGEESLPAGRVQQHASDCDAGGAGGGVRLATGLGLGCATRAVVRGFGFGCTTSTAGTSSAPVSALGAGTAGSPVAGDVPAGAPSGEVVVASGVESLVCAPAPGDRRSASPTTNALPKKRSFIFSPRLMARLTSPD